MTDPIGACLADASALSVSERTSHPRAVRVSLRSHSALRAIERTTSNNNVPTFSFEMAATGEIGPMFASVTRFVCATTCHLSLSRSHPPTRSLSLAPRRSNKATSTGPQAVVGDIAAARKKAAPPPPPPSKWRVAVGNLAAGATAGCAVEAALYPIDTIKTRLQAMRSGGGIGALIKAGGGRALYSGVWGNLVGVAPASAVFMAVYEPVKQAVIKSQPDDRAFLGPLTAGVAAGLASSVIRVPTEVVKTRMQTGEFKHAFTALKTIVAREGAKGIFAGYGSFLLRDLPFDAIEFVTYEQLKKGYKTMVLKDSRDLNAGEHSLFGAGAGAATGLVTTPLDVLKTRLMIQGQNGKYKNVFDCASKIVQEEGPAALFRGWQPRVIWIGIGGSVFFTVLEASKKLYAPKPQEG